jgi:hypothetical protein
MKKLLIILSCSISVTIVAQTGFTIDAEGSASPIILDEVRKLPEEVLFKDTTLKKPDFQYNLPTKRYVTSFVPDTINPAKLSSEPLTKLYRTYARVGVGNYGTLYGQINVMSLRSKKGAYGLRLQHHSAKGPEEVQSEYSGFSTQKANIWGTTFFGKHSLSAGFDYNRRKVSYFGSVNPENIFTENFSSQWYNLYQAETKLKSYYRDSSAINHQIDAHYYFMNDRYKVGENNFLLTANAGRYLNKEYIDALFETDYNRTHGEQDTVVNSIVRFTPRFTVHTPKFDARIGVGLHFQAGDEKLTLVYPQAYFSYNIINNIITPYVALSGGLERNSYRSFTEINPFIINSSAFGLRNTQRRYELSAGIRGSLSSEISYDAKVKLYELRNAPFFVNTSEPVDIFRNKFMIVYDDVEVVQVHGELSWQRFEKIRVLAVGDYFKYSMTNEARPWHTPALRLALTSQYNLRDKILAGASVYYLSGQYAKLINGSQFSEVTLDGLVDVNLNFEYRYTKFLSLYANFNNIAAQRYQRWYGYPTQRFNFVAGLSYTF